MSTLYNGIGIPQSLIVSIPSADPAVSGTPTGIVFNGSQQFAVQEIDGPASPAAFLFATLDGTISGWNPTVNLHRAVVAADNSPAHSVYTGLALSDPASTVHFLYAADIANNRVDVYDSSFKIVNHLTDPRHAKSAATLIAIGADEIHMGPLGQLGPIDPQIGGLPALGVSQALKTIASVSEKYPRSAEMLARYLQKALTVEQIGYCDRISESTVQYAERLLSTKPSLADRAPTIARELVHEYKDHGFVIDLDEAKAHLGNDWIKTGTTELQAAEAIYSLVEMVNFILDFRNLGAWSFRAQRV